MTALHDVAPQDRPSLSDIADIDTDPLPPYTAPCEWCTSARPCEARRRGEALGRAS